MSGPLARLFCAALLALPASAAELTGVVVRVDGQSLYLDLGAASGVVAGDRFSVFAEGEELKHPLTGASLGPIVTTLAEGRISSVQEQYSVGAVDKRLAELAAGQKVRVARGAAEAAPAPASAATAAPAAAGAREPYFRSATLDLMPVDIAVADIDGDGRSEAILASERELRAYPVRTDDAAWKPSCAATDAGTGVRNLALEAADLDGDGRAEVFVSLYNSFFKRLETRVLLCQNGAFVEKAVLPWLVGSYRREDGKRALAMQQIAPDSAFPLSGIHELEYRDGAWRRSQRRVRASRLEWLYGFSFSRRGGDPVFLYYMESGRLRLQFKKGKWSSREEYGQTSERVRWQDKTLHFHPRFYVDEDADGLRGVHTLRAESPWYSLGAPFGLYKQSQLHYLRWNGLALEPAWKAEMSGYASGLAEYDDGGAATLLVPVLGAEGNAAVWFYRK